MNIEKAKQTIKSIQNKECSVDDLTHNDKVYLLEYIEELEEIAKCYDRKYRECKMLKEELLYERHIKKDAIKFIEDACYIGEGRLPNSLGAKNTNVLYNLLKGNYE